MKRIAYVVPYFGKLPNNFALWLISCKTNPTIDWLIYTDDETTYDYPLNVKVTYCSFKEIKDKIQKKFDFQVIIDRPWKLCDFKVAYGEIFEEELKEYDFWGHCDLDIMWGDIRQFITEDILEKYDKIGFQGHSTLYKNSKEVNSRYRNKIDGIPSYKEIFTNTKGFCFDENVICDIYDKLKIPYYKETNFAHLSKYDYGFVLKYLPEEDYYKNNRQILLWDKGKLKRVYIDKENEIEEDEFMYVHFFCRPMTYKVSQISDKTKYVMYPDILEELKEEITLKYIRKKGRGLAIKYYAKNIYYNRKKITLKKICRDIKGILANKK